MPKFTNKLNRRIKPISNLGIYLFVALFPLISILFLSTKSVFATTASLSVTGNADIVYNQPTTTGDEFFKTLDVNVKTDSNTGYNLYLSSDQEETALISLDPTNPYKIVSVSGNNNNIATHMTNSYGYNVKAVDDKLYNYIPKLSTPEVIKNATSPIEENFKFNLGFRFNSQIPAGNYQRKLLFTLMVEGDSSAKLVSGRDFNAALKKSLNITDPSYFTDPSKRVPVSNQFWPYMDISIGKTKCSSSITPERTVKISTPDSDTIVYLGTYRDSWDKICIWTNATELNFNEDLSYMFAGLSGISSDVTFSFRDGRQESMLKFDKVKNVAHLFHNTLAYNDSTFTTTNFLKYLKDSPVENIESAFENTKVSEIGDISFAKNAKYIARAFKDTPNVSTSPDFSSWKISDAEDLTSVFENSKISNIDLSNSDFKNATNTANMFKNSKVSTLKLDKAKFEKVIDASSMFKDTTNLSSVDLSHTTFRDTTNASSMFESTKISNINLKNAAFENVTDFSNMFNKTKNTTKIDLSSIKFTSAENLSNMFKGSYANELKLSNQLGGSHITNLESMFEDVYYLPRIDLGSMTTGRVVTIKNMFKGAETLNNLTLPQTFNTGIVEDFSSMFENTPNLVTIGNIDKLDLSSAKNLSRMFYNTRRLDLGAIAPHLKPAAPIDLSYMFYGSHANGSVVFPTTFNTSNAVTMEGMFGSFNGSSASIDISNFSLAKVENMSKMYMGSKDEFDTNGCGDSYGIADITWPNLTVAPELKTLKSLFSHNCNIQKIKAPKITAPKLIDISYAFANLGTVNTLDLDDFDTSNVENMEGLFAGNSSRFNTAYRAKISLNTSNVKNISKLFHYTYVSYLDLSDLDVRKVTNFSKAFDYTWLYELDLTNWNTISATDMSNMFGGSTWLTKIYASDSFTTTNVTSYNGIFRSLSSYRGQAGSAIPNDNSIEYAHIDGGTANPGAFWRKP